MIDYCFYGSDNNIKKRTRLSNERAYYKLEIHLTVCLQNNSYSLYLNFVLSVQSMSSTTLIYASVTYFIENDLLSHEIRCVFVSTSNLVRTLILIAQQSDVSSTCRLFKTKKKRRDDCSLYNYELSQSLLDVQSSQAFLLLAIARIKRFSTFCVIKLWFSVHWRLSTGCQHWHDVSFVYLS